MVREKIQNTTLDKLKGLACIAVVFIHVQFPGNFGQAVIALARAAVALFFVISGYYLYQQSITKVEKSLPRKIKRTAKLTAWAFGICFVWECFVRMVGSGSASVLWYCKVVFSFDALLQGVLFSYDPVIGHLWFLLALLEAYCLILLLIRMKAPLSAFAGLALLEVHIVLMTISTVCELGWRMNIFRSALFYGLPFMLLGWSIHKQEKKLLKALSDKALLLGMFAGMALTLVERFLIGNLQIFNGSILTVVCLFLLAVRHPNTKGAKGLAVLGAKYSTDIYIYHWIVMEIVIKVRSMTGLTQSGWDWLAPLLVLCATAIGVCGWHSMKQIFFAKVKK